MISHGTSGRFHRHRGRIRLGRSRRPIIARSWRAGSWRRLRERGAGLAIVNPPGPARWRSVVRPPGWSRWSFRIDLQSPILFTRASPPGWSGWRSLAQQARPIIARSWRAGSWRRLRERGAGLTIVISTGTSPVAIPRETPGWPRWSFRIDLQSPILFTRASPPGWSGWRSLAQQARPIIARSWRAGSWRRLRERGAGLTIVNPPGRARWRSVVRPPGWPRWSFRIDLQSPILFTRASPPGSPRWDDD